MNSKSTVNQPVLPVAAALVLLTLAAFFPALRCGFVAYDDPAYVYGNPPVRDGLNWSSVKWAVTAMHASNWHPLTWLSHALDCSMFGLNPAGHHAVNVLIHALNSLLVFAMLRRLTKTFWRCALVAALFAVHPMHVESVAWISERKDVLSTFFGLLTLIAYSNHAKGSTPGRARHSVRAADVKNGPRRALSDAPNLAPSTPRLWYALALVFFALSLLSKPMLVTLPCLLLLLDFWPLGRFTIYDSRFTILRLVREKIPFFVLVLGTIPLTLMAQAKGGSVAPIGDIPLADRFANSALAVGWYVEKLFWPADIAVIYPLFPTRDAAKVLLGAIIVFGGIALAAWQWRRRPQCTTGWFWFLGTLVPVIGLVQVGMQTFADRYTYFSYIGLFIIVAWALAEIATNEARRRIIAACAVMVVGLCVVVTRHQCLFWENSETLFTRASDVTPRNYIALNNLGFALAERKEFDRAIGNYEAALSVAPRFAEALNNLGCAYLGKKEFARAAEKFRAALEIKPDDLRTLNNLGTALHEQGDFTNAVLCYEKAIGLEPDYGEAHANLANSLCSAGRVTDALPHYQRAIGIDPASPNARLNYGVELLKLGRVEEAGEQFTRALAVSTNAPNAHYWLATIARGKNDPAAEAKHLRLFLAAEPDHAQARIQLAMALGGLQQFDEALAVVREAVRRRPDHAPANYCLGVLLEQSGRDSEALGAYDAALKQDADYPEVLNNLAWLLASHRDAELRDGPRAVRLASRACELTRHEAPMLIGTLAAAHAEAGDFPKAIAVAEQAIARATSLGETNVAQRNRELLELYRAGKAFHSP